MRRHLTFFLLAGIVALAACRSKPKKKAAELPDEHRGIGGNAGSVRLREVESAVDDPKKSQPGSKPKTRGPETGHLTPKPNPLAEPKPALTEKPGTGPIKPATPKVNAAADAKADNIPKSPLVKSPVAAQPIPPNDPPLPVETKKASTPPESKTAPSTGVFPSPAPPAVNKPNADSSPPATLTRSVKPADGRPLELNVPTKPHAPAPVAEPLRTTFSTTPGQTKPTVLGPLLGVVGPGPATRSTDTRSLSLPTGGKGAPSSAASTPPLAVQFGQGTNQPPASNDVLRAIGVDPLLQGAAWREQQMAKQAAEQKAREEEQQKLKGALYRFLFKGGTNR